MNELIRGFDAVPDGDLMVCAARGVAYQADMTAGRVDYDDSYFEKVRAYEGTQIARAVVAGRVAFLSRHVERGASVIDIGAGTGAFVRAAREAGFEAKGFDVIPRAAELLWFDGIYDWNVRRYDAVTAWDALEHMDDPAACLLRVRRGATMLCSLPIFPDLARIRESKHYRPGEHLYYWTADGFVEWAKRYGFRLIETSAHETDAGRESIGAFAFRRDLDGSL